MQETIQSSMQLPERVYQLAEQYQLGQIHAVYRRRLHRFLLWLLPGWIVLGGFILGYDGYKLFLDCTGLPLPGITLQFWNDVAQLVFGIAVIALIMMGVNPFWGFKKRLYMTDNGLLYVNGKNEKSVCWHEIEAIYWWKRRGISYLSLKDGSEFRAIEEMEKAREISAVVASEMTNLLLPDVLAQYQKDGKVEFGPISVTREGIANESKLASWETAPVILWEKIEDMRFERGKIGIKMSNKWQYWDEGIMTEYKIPNPTVCVALMEHILETRKDRF